MQQQVQQQVSQQLLLQQYHQVRPSLPPMCPSLHNCGPLTLNTAYGPSWRDPGHASPAAARISPESHDSRPRPRAHPDLIAGPSPRACPSCGPRSRRGPIAPGS